MRKGKSKIKIVILNKGVNEKQSTLWGYGRSEVKEVRKPTKYNIVKNMPFKVKIFD